MGLPFGKAIDMWSLGCVLYECIVGTPPFDSVSKESLLHKMVATLGAFPRTPFNVGRLYPEFYSSNHEILTRPKASELGSYAHLVFLRVSVRALTFRFRTAVRLIEMKKDAVDAITEMERYSTSHTLLSRKLQTKDPSFVDFLQGLLCYDPNKRLTPEQALVHPFLSHLFPQGPIGTLGRVWTYRERVFSTVEFPPTISVPLGHPTYRPLQYPGGQHRAQQQSDIPSSRKRRSPAPVASPFGTGVPFGMLPNPAQSRSGSLPGRPSRKDPDGFPPKSLPRFSENIQSKDPTNRSRISESFTEPSWSRRNAHSFSFDKFTSSGDDGDDAEEDSVMILPAGGSSLQNIQPRSSREDLVAVGSYGAAADRKRKRDGRSPSVVSVFAPKRRKNDSPMWPVSEDDG